jgi:CheY-like chemotaxis protein
VTRSILIVDDEFGLADVVAEMLVEAGYEVAIAINGKLALEQLAQRPRDLVMLDVMMPIMSGPETLRTMRLSDGLSKIPVILMTSLPEAIPDDEPPLHQAVLQKPFTPERLFSTVRRLLGESS